MVDEPKDKTPESIKKHKPKLTYEMQTPLGSQVRKMEAARQFTKDNEGQIGDRAAKYANVEKAKNVATTRDMEQGTKGLLSKELNKATKDKDFDR